MRAKTLVKSTQGVNFINILRSHFWNKSELSSFYLVTFDFVIFWRKNIGTKFASKMLMKLIQSRLEIYCKERVQNWFETGLWIATFFITSRLLS